MDLELFVLFDGAKVRFFACMQIIGDYFVTMCYGQLSVLVNISRRS
jgi:hypothetical protein